MITQDDVNYIAGLARINLSPEESLPLAQDLERILEYIRQLEGVDVSEVQPTSHVLSLKNVYRDDIPVPSLTQEEALSIAVQKLNGSFKVPQIID